MNLILKKKFSLVLLVIFVVTSIFLVNETIGFFKGFPIESKKSETIFYENGVLGVFIPRFESYSEEEQKNILNQYFTNLIQKDKELNQEEYDFIINHFINIDSMSNYNKYWDNLYSIAVKNMTIEKFEDIRFDLTYTAGMTIEDAKLNIDNISKDHRISYDFAFMFLDKQIVIWSLFIFIIIAFNYYTFRNKGTELFIYQSTISSNKFILRELATDLVPIIVLILFQYMIFSIAMNINIRSTYETFITDYILTFFIIGLPSIIALTIVGYFLLETFGRFYFAGPIYYGIVFISMESGLSSNNISLLTFIVRQFKMFQPLEQINLNQIYMNRLFLMMIIVLLIGGTLKVFDYKRNGR